MDSVAPGAIAPAVQASPREVTHEGDLTHFGGPWGARVLMVFMPLVSLYLWVSIHRFEGALLMPLRSFVEALPLPTVRGALWFLGWLGFQALLDATLPGRVVTGIAQRDGQRMQYRLNGLLSLGVTLIVAGALYALGVVRGSEILAELGPILSTAVICAFAFSAFLYFYGFRSSRDEVRSGLLAYDFFMGTALNPRLGKMFDLKMFFESKVGLTTWVLLALAMAAAQFERDGSVSAEMVLVCAFQLWYVADFYFFEDAMLTTWDINYENYGFMLAFAFIVWMPFNFSLQAQYLVYHRPNLPTWALVAVFLLNAVGYYVFRVANLQKHRFRTDPNAKIWGKPPEFIATKRGTKLLTSGFWGMARHTNYLGDLMMALAWCLPAGFAHVSPYFYFIYFAPLLIDRERRDHRECAKKYGADWDTYCAKVKYRIVPGLY